MKRTVEVDNVKVATMSVEVDIELTDTEVMEEFDDRELIGKVRTGELIEELSGRMEDDKATATRVRASLGLIEENFELTSIFKESIITKLNELVERHGEAKLDQLLTKIN